MARIQEEVIVITVSKLHKNTDNNVDDHIVGEDTMTALASVAEELLGHGVVVEISKA
jgi:hypothetical protein